MSPRLLTQICQVARVLPLATLTQVANQLSDDHDQLLRQLPQATWRQAVIDLLHVWRSEGQAVTKDAIAAALLSAHHCIQQNQQDLSLEVVWTGPPAIGIPTRRTEQVLLQMIQSAQQELMLVSFAIYKVPELTQALIAALDRGVQLKIIAETPQDSSHATPFGVAAGLGADIASRAEIYEWDRAKRPRDESGRCGSLHMKVALCDRKHLFITSANLTEYALSLNMELGVIVHNEQLAEQVMSLLNTLIYHQTLTQTRYN